LLGCLICWRDVDKLASYRPKRIVFGLVFAKAVGRPSNRRGSGLTSP